MGGARTSDHATVASLTHTNTSPNQVLLTGECSNEYLSELSTDRSAPKPISTK